MKLRSLLIFSNALVIIACAPALVSYKHAPTEAITEDQYSNNSGKLGTIIIGVNWNRYWGCAGYENAELRSIGFDHMPSVHKNNDEVPDFVVNGAATGPDPVFIVYSYMLKPGNYALSRVSIKVARSMSEVGYMNLERSRLIDQNKPLGGSFNVSAGEVVYIGHFGLDCAYQPMLWRYYKEDKEAFEELMEKTQSYIPYVDLSDAQFRLFKTSEFGHDFNL